MTSAGKAMLAVLCLALLVMAGCSVLKLSYNKAPELVYWWLDGYLGFQDGQVPEIKHELAKLHDWHYRNELPRYLRLLGRMKSMAHGDIEAGQICEIVDEVRQRGRSLNTQAAKITAHIAPLLTAEQLERLQKKFDKRNAEWREDWMEGSEDDRIAHRLKLAVKRAENLYGNLDDRQIALLRRQIAESGFDPHVSYAEIQRRQRHALQLLDAVVRNELSEEEARKEIGRFYVQLIDSPDSAYRQYLQSLTRESCRITAELHNTTSTRQRLKAQARLQQYIDDLSSVRIPTAY